MSDQDKIILPQASMQPARHRGPLSSSKYNDFQAGVLEDIANLSSAVNSMYADLSKTMLILHSETDYLRRQVKALRSQQEYAEKIASSVSAIAYRYVDVGDTKGITFPNGVDDTRSTMLSASYGEITLPPNAIENKFYVTSLVNGVIVTPPDLSVRVRGTFDQLDGQGQVNYERGGRVTPGDPRNAFNGNNQSYWIRKVEFPIDSRVDQVECELIVSIPESVSADSNVIELIPFPHGSVDVTELATASDLGDNYIRLPGFSPVDNVTSTRYHFAPKTVDQIKVRLRQRNWVEENGKKVFYYGLQELALKFIDYDKNYAVSSTFGTNNSFIMRIDAPAGHTFDAIYRVDPNPNFLLEDMNLRHVHMRINTSADYSVGTLWDSDVSLTPQQANTPLDALGASTLYLFVQMNFVNESGGVLSPFPVGTTPYFKGIGMSYTLNML